MKNNSINKKMNKIQMIKRIKDKIHNLKNKR